MEGRGLGTRWGTACLGQLVLRQTVTYAAIKAEAGCSLTCTHARQLNSSSPYPYVNSVLALRNRLLDTGRCSCSVMQHCVGPQGKRAGARAFAVHCTRAAAVIYDGEGFAWGGGGHNLRRVHFNAVSCSEE